MFVPHSISLPLHIQASPRSAPVHSARAHCYPGISHSSSYYLGYRVVTNMSRHDDKSRSPAPASAARAGSAAAAPAGDDDNAPIRRSDMAGLLEQFAGLCRTSVNAAVVEAVAPIRKEVAEINGAVATLTTRIDKIEHAFAEQLAADDAEMGDPARSWASRAAGAPAAAASRPLGRVAAAAPPVARAAPAGANSKKVRISTHQGIRIKREDAEAAVAAVNTAANGGTYVFAGGPFSNQFAITYSGETASATSYARQLLASLKGVGVCLERAHRTRCDRWRSPRALVLQFGSVSEGSR